MNVILSDQQMRATMYCLADWYDCNTCDTSCILIAKAQARHLLNLLNEPCTEHPKPYHADENEIKYYMNHRYLCPECMKEIEREIEDGL